MAVPTTPVDEHRAQGPSRVRCAVITVSDTRTLDTDRSGALVAELLQGAGHEVVGRTIVPDEPRHIRHTVGEWVHGESVDAIVVTGGTGISPRDRTYETITAMFARELNGFGELFRMLSYQEIGPAAMLSRATAGVIGGTILFLLPGSTGAVRLALEKLILPELSHLVGQLRRHS